MYKVMLVDDEMLITEGLKNIIDWEKLGLSIINTAENGIDALEKFRKNPVDIIITDINMPLLDGLELLNEIKKIDNKVKFIILSGYEEFSYAKKAIEIGVQAYILKPIDDEKLEEKLKEIVKILEEERLSQKINIKKDAILKSLLNNMITKDEVLNSKEEFKIEFEEKIFVCAIILVKEALNTISFKNIDKTEVLYGDFGDIILINSFDKNTDKESIKRFYQEILEDIQDKYKYNVFISIGKTVEDINFLNRSFKTSNLVKKKILSEGFGKCIIFEENDIGNNTLYFENEINEINRLIVENKKDELEIYLNSILNLDNISPQNIYELATQILVLCDNLKIKFKINTEEIGMLGNSIIKILNFTNVSDIKEYIRGKLIFIINNIEKENIKLSPIVRRIVKCVNENYNKDLSLKVLANEYNVNTSYLGQIFTKEIGIQFSDYLNKVRNSVAKDLILNTNKKINDISKEVGYLDTSYFYRKFKKYYGVTPATLRELQNY